MKWPRFSLRVKLALVLVALLALPAAGILYVNEAERFLLQGQEQSLLAVARAVATALHERPQLLASASGRDDEVDAILLGLQRASSRIWVVDARYQVIAAAGSLRRPTEVASEAPWWQPLFTHYGWLDHSASRRRTLSRARRRSCSLPARTSRRRCREPRRRARATRATAARW